MVSCLTLLGSTHLRLDQAGGLARTLCGLAMAEADVHSGVFAREAAAATCAHCLDVSRSGSASAVVGDLRQGTRALITRLLDQLNAEDATGLSAILGGRLLESITAQRLQRLHQLFPAWCASVDELIMDEGNAVLRYRVACLDACGLLGGAEVSGKAQCVIFRSANHRLVDAFPIVDDFAFWSSAAMPRTAGCAHCADIPDSSEGPRP